MAEQDATPAAELSPTPLVDAVITDPLRAPLGVPEWLRSIERDVRDAKLQIAHAVAVGASLPVVHDAARELDDFLADDTGFFQRTLRRPLWYLTPDKPGHTALARRVDALLELAQAASTTLFSVGHIMGRVKTLETEYAGRFPRTYHRLLRAARLDDEHLQKIRRLPDAERASSRVAWLSDRLTQLAAATPTIAVPGDALSEGPATPTIGELRALLALRLRERDALMRRGGIDLDRLARHHRDALISAAGRALSGRSGIAQAIEDVVTEPAMPGAPHSPVLWQALVGEARDHLDGLLRTRHWEPASRRAESAGQAAQAMPALHVVAIDDDLVAISPALESCVVVHGDIQALGATIDAGLAPADRPIAIAVGALDLPPLFDGYVENASAWYGITRPAHLRVIAQAGETWFAQVIHPGALVALPHPAWRAEAPQTSSIHVLTYARSDAMEVIVGADASAREASRYVMGFRTTRVRTPFLDLPNLSLRVPEPATAARTEALARERACFQTLAARGVAVAEPIGPGRLEDGDPGVLYREPPSIPGGLPQLLRYVWDDSTSRRAILGSLARILLSADEAHWCIGLLHPLVLGAAVRDGRPSVSLLQAPQATRLREEIVVAASIGDRDRITFPQLCTKGLALTSAAGKTATRLVDGAAFAILVLELSAREPVRRGAVLTWSEMLELAREDATRLFSNPKPAVRLIDAIGSGDEMALWDIVRRSAERASA